MQIKIAIIVLRLIIIVQIIIIIIIIVIVIVTVIVTVIVVVLREGEARVPATDVQPDAGPRNEHYNNIRITLLSLYIIITLIKS